jgi:hypothetical protein
MTSISSAKWPVSKKWTMARDGNVDCDVLEIVVARVLDPQFSSRLSHVAFDWQRLLQVFRCQRVGVHEVGVAAFEHS